MVKTHKMVLTLLRMGLFGGFRGLREGALYSSWRQQKNVLRTYLCNSPLYLSALLSILCRNENKLIFQTSNEHWKLCVYTKRYKILNLIRPF